MTSTHCWIGIVVLGIVGLAALFVSAGADSEAAYWIGLGVFAVCVLGTFWLLRKAFDVAGARPRDSEDTAHR